MRIYTYKDPYLLKNSEIWNKIEKAPHFCASEVLAIGLRKKWGRDSFECLSTVDELLKNIFPNWLSDTGNEVKRYVDVAEIVDNLDQTSINAEMKETFQKSKRNLLEAIKYLIETEEQLFNEKSEVLFSYNNQIQKDFVEFVLEPLLKEIYVKGKLYWIPDWQQTEAVKINIADAIRKCNVDEIRKLRRKFEEETGSLKEQRENALNWFKSLFNEFGKYVAQQDRLKVLDYKKSKLEHLYKLVVNEKANVYRSMVFHGVYRFSAIQLKLFEELEKAGYEVIILNCYNPEFPKVYGCWTSLYKKLIKKYHIKKKEIIVDDKIETSKNCRQSGYMFGQIIEGKEVEENELEEIEFVKYSNTMQFVNEVSLMFDKTSPDDKGKRTVATMEEQFYGVKGTELNNIFQVFYPDEFGIKPFLSYPIGQFIASLYNMWDVEEKILKLTDEGLTECLNLDVWDQISPVVTYKKIRNYLGLDKFYNGYTIDEFLKRTNELGELLELMNKKQAANKYYRWFTYCRLETEELDRFRNVIKDFEKLAEILFSKPRQLIKENYAKMIRLLNEMKGWKPLSIEEKKLVDEIEVRLGDITVDSGEGNISTIRETMGFYLHNTEGSNINWLVRDLDQLEGDLLLVENNGKNDTQAKVFHYAMLSNENMFEAAGTVVPWPLNSDFVNNKKTVEILQCIAENNSNYKRCQIFQAMYYLRDQKNIRVKLSYIENVGKDLQPHQPYYLLNQLFKTTKVIDEDKHVYNIKPLRKPLSNVKINETGIDSEKAVELFSICPYKFMYSITDKFPILHYSNAVQVRIYFSKMTLDILHTCYKKTPAKEEIEKFAKKIIKAFKDNKILGAYCLDIEIEKIVNDQKEYLYHNPKHYNRMDYELNVCWINKVKERYQLDNYFELVNRTRVEIIERYINNYDTGFEFPNHNQYQIVEEICIYCAYNNVCLYKYRQNPYHLTKNGEDNPLDSGNTQQGDHDE